MNARLATALSLALVCLGAFAALASESPARGDARAVALRAQAEMVAAVEQGRRAFAFVGGGSGVCISPDGYVLTNYHVAGRKPSWTVRVYGSGKLYVGEVCGNDPLGDVTLLKLKDAQNVPHVPLADLAKARVGESVLAVGDPFKLADIDGAPGVSLGILSARHRYQGPGRLPSLLQTGGSLLSRGAVYFDALQTDAAVNPGNSGGPLLNLRGELLGLTGQIMARFDPKANSRIAYAVPADQLARFLPLLKEAKGGTIHHGTLPEGLTLEDGNAWPGAQPGVTVTAVASGSAAAEAGFCADDKLLFADGEAVETLHRLMGIVQSRPEDAEVAFTVVRGQSRQRIVARLPRLVVSDETPPPVTEPDDGEDGSESGHPAPKPATP